jgi:hypothetical protein
MAIVSSFRFRRPSVASMAALPVVASVDDSPEVLRHGSISSLDGFATTLGNTRARLIPCYG